MKYLVTRAAGSLVAGMRNPGVGQEIELSDAQAAQPLRQGHIVAAAPAPVKEKPKGKAKEPAA